MEILHDYGAYRVAILADARHVVHALPPAELAAFDRAVAATREQWTIHGALPWTAEAERGALIALSALKILFVRHHAPDALHVVNALERTTLALREDL